MKRLGVLTAICLMMAAQPVAADIPRQEWTRFVADNQEYNVEPSPEDWEAVLRVASRTTKSQSAAIAEFARRTGVSPAAAERYAEVIVATIFHSLADEDKAPPFVPGQRLYDLANEVAMSEPTGRLLVVIGRYVSPPADFIRLAKGHPAATSVFIALDVFGDDSPFILATLQSVPADPSAIPPPVLWPNWRMGAIKRAPQNLAAVEAVYRRMDAMPGLRAQTAAWRAALSRYLMIGFLKTGMDPEALTLYRANAAELTPFWLENRKDHYADHAGDRTAQTLAAALWRDGDTDPALALLDRLEKPTSLMTDMIRDAISPAFADDRLYGFYTEGRPCDYGISYCEYGDETEAMTYQTAFAPPVVKGLLSARLKAAGYAAIAADVAVLQSYDLEGYYAGSGHAAELMPQGADALVPVWQARIDNYRAQARASAEPAGPVRVTLTKAPAHWREMPLPEGIKPWSGDDTAPLRPGASQLPSFVPPAAVLRYERRGRDATVVYASPRYDPPGLAPTHGLWLARRLDGKWQAPLYLGLRQYMPYVATFGSRLPLISADGQRLQLEVRQRELDPQTLNVSRGRDGLWLDIALGDLTRDSDGDGLSDITETGLGLKPDHADSDGDGMDDARDPVPLTAVRTFAQPYAEDGLRLILATLIDTDGNVRRNVFRSPKLPPEKAPETTAFATAQPGAVLSQTPPPARTQFLIADPDLFAGIVKAPAQLIVYSPADLKALGRNDATFDALRLTRLYHSPNGKQWYAEWSTVGQGGTLVIDCSAGACRADTAVQWRRSGSWHETE